MRPVILVLIGLALGYFIRRFHLAAILAAAAISVVAIEARAVTITNLTSNTVVFHDDFESGNFSSPSAGTWTIPSDVTVISAITPPTPDPPRESSMPGASATPNSSAVKGICLPTCRPRRPTPAT